MSTDQGKPQVRFATAPDGSRNEDFWQALRTFTPARIALGRSGVSLPTRQALDVSLSHAMARDAIHLPLDVAILENKLSGGGWDHVRATSRITGRSSYLMRPDLGRRLDEESSARLCRAAESRAVPDIVFVIADGLSPLAVNTYAAGLLDAVKPLIAAGTKIAPVVIAEQARVALGDEVAEIFGARLVVMLIGERPGLSSRDSLGAYLTCNAQVGIPDSARNCVSNIRAEGLPVPAAATKLAWFIRTVLERGVTGIGLKDESDSPACLSGF